MKTYTYLFHYNNSQVAEIKNSKMRIDWDHIGCNTLLRFNTANGTMTINMSHVISIEEIITEKSAKIIEMQNE